MFGTPSIWVLEFVAVRSPDTRGGVALTIQDLGLMMAYEWT